MAKKRAQMTLEQRQRANAAMREWRRANPDKVAAARKRWHAAHPEKRRESRRKWKAANAEKVRIYKKAWRAANLDQIRAKLRAWRAANPDKRRENARRNRDAILSGPEQGCALSTGNELQTPPVRSSTSKSRRPRLAQYQRTSATMPLWKWCSPCSRVW
jgi:hypothetical protein